MSVAGDPDEPVRPPGFGQPGIHGGLHVDVLVAGPVLLGDREAVGGRLEVLADEGVEAGLLVLARLGDQASYQPPPVPADVSQLGRAVQPRGLSIVESDGGGGSER